MKSNTSQTKTQDTTTPALEPTMAGVFDDSANLAEIIVSLRRILAQRPTDGFIAYEAQKALAAAGRLSVTACV